MNHAFFTPPLRITCSAHLLLLYLITLIIFGQDAHVVTLLTELFLSATCHFSLSRPDTQYGSIFESSYEAIHSVIFWVLLLNPLETKRRLLYLKTQFVPRSKHFSSRL